MKENNNVTFEGVTRVEVIDNNGRPVVFKYPAEGKIEFSLEDGEKTLKMFVTYDTREQDWKKQNRWLNPFSQP